MISLNFSNAEELIFYDTAVQNKLPADMFSIFEQWRLAMRIPYLRQMGRQAILDFLNRLTDEDLQTLEAYFGEKIAVERLNYNIVHNLTVPLSEEGVCHELCTANGFSYLSTWRDNDYLYISMWR